MKDALEYVKAALREGLHEANSWGTAFFGCSDEELAELQCCVRGGFDLANMKFAYLEQLPYVMVHILKPGVKEKCRAAWESCPPDKHHPLTRHWWEPGTQLRADIDSLAPDCSNPSQLLLNEISLLEAMPMDDSIAEYPHAKGKAATDRARHLKFAGLSSGMRLDQNLTDVYNYVSTVKADLQAEWMRYKQILQVKPSKLGRNVRMSPKRFQECVYSMGMFQDQSAPGGSGTDLACENGDDDSGGPDLPPAPEAEAAAEHRAASSSVVPAAGAAPASRAAGLSDIVPLLREFLLVCLQPAMFVSLPIVEGDGTIVPYICQVLRLQPQVTTVKLFSDDLNPKGLLDVAVQPLQRWSPVGNDPADLGHCIEVYVLEEPTRLDILKHIEPSFRSRSKMFQWKSGRSCLRGCLSLVDPVQLAPPGAWTLSHAKMPTLCLLDALREQGFRPVNRLVEHSTSTSKEFDGRKRVSKSQYFRCVLASGDLFAAGITSFKSNHSQTFYAYLMRFKKLPDPKQTAAQLQKLINDADTDEPCCTELSVRPPAAAPPDPSIAWVDDTDDEQLAALPAPEPAVPEPVEDLDAAAAIEQAVIADLQDHDLAPEWPTHLDGVRLTVESENVDPAHHYHARLKIRCNNPEHLLCTKSRSTALQTEVFGINAPLYYLGAWLAASDMREADHKRHKPTVAAIRAYIASKSAEG